MPSLLPPVIVVSDCTDGMGAANHIETPPAVMARGRGGGAFQPPWNEGIRGVKNATHVTRALLFFL